MVYTDYKKVLDNLGILFLEHPNINSVGIARKITEEGRLNDLSIRFTVDRLLTKENAKKNSVLIPEFLEFEGIKVPTDVVERRYWIKRDRKSDLQKKIEPNPKRIKYQEIIRPGISISSILVTKQAGTIGCIVFDKSTKDPFILSNYHILVKLRSNRNSKIIQPARLHGGYHIKHELGKLNYGYMGIDGDFAIASIDNRNYSTEVFDLGVSPSHAIDPTGDELIVKSGVGTNVTCGTISCADQITSISLGRRRYYIRAFEIRNDPSCNNPDGEISEQMDSGSLILERDINGVATETCFGLLFGGEISDQFEEHAVACYMTSILKRLDVTLNK